MTAEATGMGGVAEQLGIEPGAAVQNSGPTPCGWAARSVAPVARTGIGVIGWYGEMGMVGPVVVSAMGALDGCCGRVACCLRGGRGGVARSRR